MRIWVGVLGKKTFFIINTKNVGKLSCKMEKVLDISISDNIFLSDDCTEISMIQFPPPKGWKRKNPELILNIMIFLFFNDNFFAQMSSHF